MLFPGLDESGRLEGYLGEEGEVTRGTEDFAASYNIQDAPLLGWEYHSGLLTVKGRARPA